MPKKKKKQQPPIQQNPNLFLYILEVYFSQVVIKHTFHNDEKFQQQHGNKI